MNETALRITLPPLRKRTFLSRGLRATKLAPLLSKMGIYQEDRQPFNADGTVNPAYANIFTERYHLKSFYADSHKEYMPPFPLAGAHMGARFIIFGNGPSLKKFDFGRIKNAVTIGTNVASEFYHARYVLISAPKAFIRASQFFDFNKSTLLVGGGMWNARTRRDLWKDARGKVVPVAYTEGTWSLEGNRLVGSGHNVGQMAVDVALLFGASSILLVGVDGYQNRKLKDMYAGSYAQTYGHTIPKTYYVSIKEWERIMWERDEKVHEEFLMKQSYCEKKGIAFGVWGDDCVYKKLKQVLTSELDAWC